jgi:hypothetical protein
VAQALYLAIVNPEHIPARTYNRNSPMSSHTSATINYAVQQPSYGFTDRTTDFDDALLQRGIVTMEQVLLAKGMSVQDAQCFIERQQEKESRVEEGCTDVTQGMVEGNSVRNALEDGDDDSDFDCDDEFLHTYHQRRIAEFQERAGGFGNESHRISFGDVVHIDRSEWKREVNEGSMNGHWVVVGLLSSSDSERTARMEQAIRELSRIHIHTKFVLIPSHRAIADWPEANLPSLFLYKDGTMQHELIRLPVNFSTEELEDRLTALNVL